MTTYPVNFITKVITLIEFQPILILKKEEPIELQDKLRGQFPRYQKKETIDVKIKPGQVPIASKTPLWQFANKDNTEEINLNFQSLSFICNKYYNYESFISKIEIVFNLFNDIYRPDIINKIGLRFINEIKIKGKPFNWDGIINSNLWCFINTFPDTSTTLTRAMSQLHINLGDHAIIFQYGIFNSAYPSIITQKEFILDYDCSSQEEYESGDVLNKLKIFYEDIKKLFKQSRGDKLVRIMKGEEV